MSDVLGVLFGIYVLATCLTALVGVAAVIATVGVTAGHRRDRTEARVILFGAAAVPLAPLWPLVLLWAGYRHGPTFTRGLWSDAELPSPAERRDRRAAERDHLVRVQARRIADLERELGIGGAA